MREQWEARYAGAEFAYGTAPNDFVVECEALLPRGSRVLLPGDGEGGNGAWLAARGHHVTSVDLAESGLRKARELAASQGASLETIRADLADWQSPLAAFDALVLIFLHLPPALRADVHRRLARTLRPGGLLILEAFERAHAGLPGGGQSDPSWLFDQQMLATDFAELQPVAVRCTSRVLDEGLFHRGEARLIRYLARAR